MPSISVYRGPDRGVNLGCGVLLDSGQNVAVKIKGDPNARMSEAILRHLGVNAAGTGGDREATESAKNRVPDSGGRRLLAY
jgi:hypothetical protein